MSVDIASTIIEIIKIGGGLSGFISLILILKKLRKKVKFLGSIGTYKIDEKDNSTMHVKTEISIFNEKEEQVAITDIVGSVKQDHSRFLPVISVKPLNYEKLIPKNVKPHESVKLSLEFVIPSINPKDLNRFKLMHFMGFTEGNIPLYFTDERINQLNWENNPIIFQVAIHINGSKVKKTFVGLYKEEYLDKKWVKGSLDEVEIARLERDFMKDK